MDRLKHAEQEYRKAFQDFAAKVERVQTLSSQSHVDPKVVEAALLELERAHVHYDVSRDRWAQFFLPSENRGPLSEHSHEDCIPTIAKLLWESAGCPEGTAEQDWRKAEEIVKQAAAAVAA